MIPSKWSSGIPSSFLLRAITSASFAFPIFDRCDRPTAAPRSTSLDHPGRFADGPEEKHGFLGSKVGFMNCRAGD
jgi:hypothetical protein